MMGEVDVLIGSKRRWELNRQIGRVWPIDGGALGRGVIMRWQVSRD